MVMLVWMYALAALAPSTLATLSAREALEAQYATVDAVARPWMTWADEGDVLEFRPVA